MSPLVRITTWAGLLAATALTASLTAQVASADTTRVFTAPADNAVLAADPGQVSATFHEQLPATFAPTVQGAVVGVGGRPRGSAGGYPVHYRVTPAGDHLVSGSWSFQLTAPGTGTPGPAAAATHAGSDIPDWAFGVVTVVLVAAGALWAVRRRP